MGLFDSSSSTNEQFNTTSYLDFDYTTSVQDSGNTNTSITKTVENSNNNTNNSQYFTDASTKLLDSLNTTVAPNIAVFGNSATVSKLGSMGLDLNDFFSKTTTPTEASVGRDTTGFFNSGQVDKAFEANAAAKSAQPIDWTKLIYAAAAILGLALILKFKK